MTKKLTDHERAVPEALLNGREHDNETAAETVKAFAVFIARLDSAYDEMEATVRKLHDLMSENRQMRSRIKSEFKIP